MPVNIRKCILVVSQKLKLVDTGYVHAISYIVLIILFSLVKSKVDARMLFLLK